MVHGHHHQDAHVLAGAYEEGQQAVGRGRKVHAVYQVGVATPRGLEGQLLIVDGRLLWVHGHTFTWPWASWLAWGVPMLLWTCWGLRTRKAGA